MADKMIKNNAFFMVFFIYMLYRATLPECKLRDIITQTIPKYYFNISLTYYNKLVNCTPPISLHIHTYYTKQWRAKVV